jgi:hypothetical protein
MPEPVRREPSGDLDEVSARDTSPTVTEVVRFEDLPLGSRGSRRAVVRWSDGSEGEALSWYGFMPIRGLCRHDRGCAVAGAVEAVRYSA